MQCTNGMISILYQSNFDHQVEKFGVDTAELKEQQQAGCLELALRNGKQSC